MTFLAGDVETVTIVRPPARDRYGDRTGAATETDLAGCLFAPGATQEFLTAANQVNTDATVYVPAGSDVRPDDRVRIRGELFDVAGAPQVWNTSGIAVPLRRVTG